MKYYLGYLQDDELFPIKDTAIGEGILDVVDFTTKFKTTLDLCFYLHNNDLIPKTYVELYYVIEKGPKGKKTYVPINAKDNMYIADNIYTSDYKRFFEPQDIQQYLSDLEYDPDFMYYLYTQYILKYGIDKKIAKYLTDISGSIPKLKNVIYDLARCLESLPALTLLNEIIEYIDSKDFQEEVLKDKLNRLLNIIFEDKIELTNTTICLLNDIEVNKIPTFVRLTTWIKEVIRKLSGDYDKESSIDRYREAFINEVMYDYDSNLREYKKVDGKYKIKEREFFDLASIITDYHMVQYEEYLEALREIHLQDNKPKHFVQYSSDYDEEFLEEDDFRRMGTTSVKEGIKIRKPCYE